MAVVAGNDDASLPHRSIEKSGVACRGETDVERMNDIDAMLAKLTTCGAMHVDVEKEA